MAQGPCLLSVSVDDQRFAGERDADEGGNEPSGVGPHSRATGVEEAHDPHIQTLARRCPPRVVTEPGGALLRPLRGAHWVHVSQALAHWDASEA